MNFIDIFMGSENRQTTHFVLIDNVKCFFIRNVDHFRCSVDELFSIIFCKIIKNLLNINYGIESDKTCLCGWSMISAPAQNYKKKFSVVLFSFHVEILLLLNGLLERQFSFHQALFTERK